LYFEVVQIHTLSLLFPNFFFFFLSSTKPVTNDIYTKQKHLVLVQCIVDSPSKFH
jgi:hypothetical protein